MTIRYFFSQSGDYLGGFDEGSLDLVPSDATEVQTPPDHGLDKLINGVIVPYVQPKTLNETLESAFLSILPKHLGQPYLTNDLITQIGIIKQAITDFNKLGLYTISRGMLAGLVLPSEMEADRQSLIALYPSS